MQALFSLTHVILKRQVGSGVRKNSQTPSRHYAQNKKLVKVSQSESHSVVFTNPWLANPNTNPNTSIIRKFPQITVLNTGFANPDLDLRPPLVALDHQGKMVGNRGVTNQNDQLWLVLNTDLTNFDRHFVKSVHVILLDPFSTCNIFHRPPSIL